jgi:hypothetical protein
MSAHSDSQRERSLEMIWDQPGGIYQQRSLIISAPMDQSEKQQIGNHHSTFGTQFARGSDQPINLCQTEALMSNVSRFETLTKRHVQIQKTTKKFIFDLQRMAQLLEADINIEEERTGVFDLRRPDYSPAARQLRVRHDNLKATIFRLEQIGSMPAGIPSYRQLRQSRYM